MFAASPQRELKRDWEECVGTLAYLMISQNKTVGEIRSMISFGCAEQDSRLTGAMVREFGYEQGNSAMQSLRSTALQVIERRISARDNPPIPVNQVAQLRDGWTVTRNRPGSCTARHVYPELSGARMVVLSRASDGDQVAFGIISDAAKREAQRFGNRARIMVPVATFHGMSGTPRGELPFTVMELSTSGAFATPITDSLLNMLDDADTLQISVSAPGSMIAIPHTYDVRGLRAAWNAVLDCSRQ